MDWRLRMNWREEKQRAEILIQELNSLDIMTELYRIEIAGAGRLWKSVWKGKQNISEGFKTWREIAIFLSGFRKALGI